MKSAKKHQQETSIDFIPGTRQFARGWNYFGDMDVAAIQEWWQYDLRDELHFVLKEKMELEDAEALFCALLLPFIEKIHYRMTQIEHNELLQLKDIVSLLMMTDIVVPVKWPRDFFVLTVDGLRFLWRDGKFESIMLAKKFYLMELDGMIYAGHFLHGTWVWDRALMG